jgi:isoleucyl-tRNA synthetase
MSKSLPTVPDFPLMEKKWLEYWQKQKIVEKYLKKNQESNKNFSFIDGPITANNPMGVHHGWGRTYKDLWQKFHNLLGFKQRFQNGFDCQGLWVEVEVEKALGLKSKKEIENLVPNNKIASIAKFVQLCKDQVNKFSKIQTNQSKRLGYFMDWDNSYFTMSDDNNYMIWYFLHTCYKEGWIYKGRESVPWCPRCETAISQHEMLTEDYKEVMHESIYLELPLQGNKDEFLLIWTTTPWTIPANIAVAVDKNLSYSLIEGTSGKKFWVATEAVSRVFGKNYRKQVKTVKGSELVGLKYSAPFDFLPSVAEVAMLNPDKFHIVIATDPKILPVSTAEGTGLIHTAVSAGVEDFKLGKLYGLPMVPVIDDSASYLENLGFLSGQNAKKQPRIILDYLISEDQKPGTDWVFKIESYKHRYPGCWRCKTELVWKVADEWYIAMDKKSKTKFDTKTNKNQKRTKTLREMMISTTKEINWIPKFGLERELDWLSNMHDWLISKKNRYWGLALPIYECSECKNFTVIESKEKLKETAVTGWEEFEGHSPHKPWIDLVKIKCPHCKGTAERISDVGNPWLDAGIVPFSTIKDPRTGKVSYLANKKHWQEWFPADFITESFPGQFKNWFYSLIAMATVLEQTNPFKTVLGFATLLDEKGNAMHKSTGNMIEFNEGADKIGVDVMRWLYLKQDPKRNLLFGYNKAEEIKRSFHIPLWNIIKFFLTYSRLDKWEITDSSSTKELPKNLPILDQWIVSRLSQTKETVLSALKAYKPQVASLEIESFVNDLSSWFIRLSRNRVWNNSSSNQDKDNFYSTLYYCIKDITIILSPFLPFFSEELYSFLKAKKNSVHLEIWPNDTNAHQLNQELNKDMEKIREVAEMGHSERKKEQIKVRQPLAEIIFTLEAEKYPRIIANLADYEELLAGELNIKRVVIKKGKKTTVCLDTILTSELKWEGKVRDMIRIIQRKRKTIGCTVTDKINIVVPSIPEEYRKELMQKVLAKSAEFIKTDTIEVNRAE